jgi:hypothetical protein
MPYYITDKSEECSGWAVVKDTGEVLVAMTQKNQPLTRQSQSLLTQRNLLRVSELLSVL